MSERFTDLRQRLESLLRRGPHSAGELLALLPQVESEAALERLVREAGGSPGLLRFHAHGQPHPLYAATRAHPLPSPQPMFRINEEGRVHEAGGLSLLCGGASLLRWNGSAHEAPAAHLHPGLPPSLAAAAPSGWLGARIARRYGAHLGVPPRVRDWSDDDRIRFLCLAGADVPGALVWGRQSLNRLLRARQREPLANDAASLARAYGARAEQAVRSGAFAGLLSSAGGEQSKFACEVEGRGHLLVKFARAGTRGAEMLALEELALRTLRESGEAAADARCWMSGGWAWLEVQRFDRIGRIGRRGAIAAGAVDDEWFGQRDDWTAFADRCRLAGWLDANDVRAVALQAVYGELIGNRDRHFENLSLLTDARGVPCAAAPAYDVLPTIYAPLPGGIEPALHPVRPSVRALRRSLAGDEGSVWPRAQEAALRFWLAAAHDARLDAPLRGVCGENAQRIACMEPPPREAQDDSQDPQPSNAPPRG